jgi:hypothetical protein
MLGIFRQFSRIHSNLVVEYMLRVGKEAIRPLKGGTIIFADFSVRPGDNLVIAQTQRQLNSAAPYVPIIPSSIFAAIISLSFPFSLRVRVCYLWRSIRYLGRIEADPDRLLDLSRSRLLERQRSTSSFSSIRQKELVFAACYRRCCLPSDAGANRSYIHGPTRNVECHAHLLHA